MSRQPWRQKCVGNPRGIYWCFRKSWQRCRSPWSWACRTIEGHIQWAQGFDKALLSKVEGLSPNGSR